MKARDIILHARETIIGGKWLRKTEVVVPEIGSAAAGCTAALKISASVDTAPPFLVVDGGKNGHAVVRVTPSDGSPAFSIPLSSRLQDGAIAVRRTSAGFVKTISDLFAAHFASFAMKCFPNESKVLATDGATVQSFPTGLTRLLDAGVHVIVEPSKLSHLLQALTAPALLGGFNRACGAVCWSGLTHVCRRSVRSAF